MQAKQRRCIACRESKPQSEMLRVARVNNEYLIDIKQKLDGRGAYICKDKNCLDLVIKKRILNRAFKTNIANEVYDLLGEYEKNN